MGMGFVGVVESPAKLEGKKLMMILAPNPLAKKTAKKEKSEEKPGENDRVFEMNGLKIYVDPKAYLYLNSMTIDFHSDMMSSGFTFTNPNEKGRCGCGESFRV